MKPLINLCFALTLLAGCAGQIEGNRCLTLRDCGQGADRCTNNTCQCGDGALCAPGQACGPSGCSSACTPSCTGRCAGEADGCGGTCTGESCCTPSCAGRCAGEPDGCGGTCTADCCTPSCAGQCAGASDGCGGTCATNTCTGCCSGTTCSAGTSATACGLDGGACDDCRGHVLSQLCRADGACGPAVGTNLSGMEWASPSLRYGNSSMPNLNFTVPRAADVAYLAANGFTRTRLPIQWELLQPMLASTVADPAARAAIGEPGAFHQTYESYITDVLDAHAAVGAKAIIDLHNYCRYQDFVFQADGSVIGLTPAADPLLRPYTSDGSQVQVRVCALAAGARLTRADFADLWRRVATKWKDHPGFGGYGLMNEPHDLPVPGGTEASNGGEDLTIWPTFAQAGIDAIRAVDSINPIYVSGNGWDSAMALPTSNPGFPLRGSNLIYEVHLYLDAFSNGYAFDYDTEVAKNYSAGFGAGPINANTGVDRLALATAWAELHGVPLALTEVGMPIDDARWELMFTRTLAHARQHGVEVYSWMGGNHWPIHNYALNQVPGWHQDKTLEASVAGPLKRSAAISQATLFDDGPGAATAGTPLTITVYTRGALASPVSVQVSSSSGGTFNKTTLSIPAGANGEDSFTFTPAAEGVVTLTYARADGGQVPPPRKVYALTDPVAYAATNLKDAAMAILARYRAAKWELADGFTDYLQGRPANDGEVVRAISDSGFGSSAGNAMEMINWINKDNPVSGSMVPPVLQVLNGKKSASHAANGTFGFWCKKSVPTPNVQPNPRNRVPYDLEAPHFVIAAVSVPSASNSGVVFQASRAEADARSELGLLDGKPQATWVDSNGMVTQLTAPTALTPGTPAVLAFTASSGAQQLRVNSATVGSSSATLAPSAFNQLLIGWGFLNYYPRGSFGGNVFAVITGAGAPTPAELSVLERYLATTAGFNL